MKGWENMPESDQSKKPEKSEGEQQPAGATPKPADRQEQGRSFGRKGVERQK